MTQQPPEPVHTVNNGQQVEFAEPFARGMARIIDSVIHTALGVGGLLLIFSATFCIWCATHETDRQLLHIGIYALVGWALYEPVTVAWRGQTLGKAICGIKVIRVSDGETPHIGQTTVRWVVPAIVGLVLSSVAGQALAGTDRGFGLLAVTTMWAPAYLSSFLDNGVGRRGWHDKAAGTIVVKVPRRIPSVDVDGSGSTAAVGRGSTTSGQTSIRSAGVGGGVTVDDSDRWDVKASAAIVAFVSKVMGRSKRPPERPEPRGDRG